MISVADEGFLILHLESCGMASRGRAHFPAHWSLMHADLSLHCRTCVKNQSFVKTNGKRKAH